LVGGCRFGQEIFMPVPDGMQGRTGRSGEKTEDNK